ncbi:hypothetical protein Bca4012_094835 [Brassica carinata]|uniref:F-box associated beta-propeller type 1 domain-containing protein n=3 Tax=Brassica TaxID=3705 RepID=A0A0D3DRY0_BRAOL|nr:PREDICTED: putative F-box protein At1g57580 isoform X1 [Brassica oleracea var. oleracea]XP_013674334.1 putative F-box protein At1g57580 [Brassica napus]KAG2257679.1 hypothetical protein Bca52824_076973 [Brassica carinata]CAF2110761.1 unnamed protein product [Brassica napus]CDY17779.1 BnaC08g21870D [Brassica napus]
MDSLPGHLLNKVLFKTDLRALAMLCCTNTSLQSHIHDPSFVSEYYSQIKSSLLHISTYGSPYLVYHHPHSGSRSHKTKNRLMECHILECCSGLLLLFIDGRLCVTNPIRKKFRFLTRRDKRKQLGLAVNQLDRTTQNFKVVYIFEMAKTDQTKYGFEINAGDSWTYSKTTLTCHTNNLDDRMKNPVYLNGSLHWLRNDGSIIAFNPETEQARLIQTDFPRGLTSRTLFAPGVNSLTLVSANENILSDPKWVLEKQIQNGVIDKIVTWYVEAYNGKCLVLRTCYDGVVHVYDLSASKWAVMGSVPTWCDANRDFFLFTPSSSSVVGLDEILACGDRRISSLRLIMGLVDGSSSEKVE